MSDRFAILASATRRGEFGTQLRVQSHLRFFRPPSASQTQGSVDNYNSVDIIIDTTEPYQRRCSSMSHSNSL